MKRREAIELYKVMSTVRLTGMTSASKMAVLENLRVLRPVSESYEADMKQAVEALKPEGFAGIEERAKLHNEALREKKEDGRLSKEELDEINALMRGYYGEVGEYESGLLDGEVEAGIKPIDRDGFTKLLEANDIEAGKLETLMRHLVSEEAAK